MIVLEPATSKTPSGGAALRRRELSRFLSCAAETIGLSGEVSVLLAGDERIRALNRDFRGQDHSTDVLSVPAAPPFAAAGHAGDLAISLEAASRQAAEHGHLLQTEVKLLMLHGLLHLAGFDHESDSGQMARREARLRKQLALPLGLIQRATPPRPARTRTRRP
jgi:probable rRNA maturation factor